MLYDIDESAVIQTSEEKLQDVVFIFSNMLEQYELKVSAKKSKKGVNTL